MRLSIPPNFPPCFCGISTTDALIIGNERKFSAPKQRISPGIFLRNLYSAKAHSPHPVLPPAGTVAVRKSCRGRFCRQKRREATLPRSAEHCSASHWMLMSSADHWSAACPSPVHRHLRRIRTQPPRSRHCEEAKPTRQSVSPALLSFLPRPPWANPHPT